MNSCVLSYLCSRRAAKPGYYSHPRHEATIVDKDQPAVKRNTSNLKQEKPTPAAVKSDAKPNESDGPKGLEPTRYGDWERKGIAVDF